MKHFLCLFILLSFIQSVNAGDEGSLAKTILPDSTITFKREITIRANRGSFSIADRTASRSGDYNYLVASCDFYTKDGAVPYDRKISAGRMFTITNISTSGNDTDYVNFQLDSGARIVCFGWGQRVITISTFRSMLDDKDINLDLVIPEL